MYEGIVFLRGGKFISKGKWRHITRTIESTELILVLSGEVKIFVGDERLCVTEGEVLRISPRLYHGGYEDSENVSFFWLHFAGAAPDELPPAIYKPKNFERIKTLTKELLHYHEQKEYPKECADSLIKVLLAEITHGRADSDGKLIAEIKEYIRVNIEEPLKASDIATRYNYNEDYLNRLFKKRLGVGLKKYIDSARLESIKSNLLMSNLSLTEIAYRYGFGECKYLLKFFKYHEGISPSKYREAYYGMHTNQK